MANWLSEEPRSLLRAMSMTVCDLSAITKPWPIEKRVAELVSSEFFEQGDMERQELNIMPIVCTIFQSLTEWGLSKKNYCKSNFAGHYESREGITATADAGEFHRLDLYTSLWGETHDSGHAFRMQYL